MSETRKYAQASGYESECSPETRALINLEEKKPNNNK